MQTKRKKRRHRRSRKIENELCELKGKKEDAKEVEEELLLQTSVSFIKNEDIDDKEEFKLEDLKNRKFIKYYREESEQPYTMVRNKSYLKDLLRKKLERDGFTKDMKNHLSTLSTTSHLIDNFEPGSGETVKDGQSILGYEGKLITGRNGGATSKFKERHGKNRISKASMTYNATNITEKFYEGRGAYTGVIDNPIDDHTSVYPTERVAYTIEEKFSDSLKLEKISCKIDLNKLKEIKKPIWGLIEGKDTLKSISENGMGPIPEIETKPARIGYVHGMCTAIVKCKTEGPWATPYEMATGSDTTKMASCFACTTYMYANGYPPSSIHLGRGESWVPPQSDHVRLEENKFNSCDCSLHADTCLKEWQQEISGYIDLGIDCISRNYKNLDSNHRDEFSKLRKEILALKDAIKECTPEKDSTNKKNNDKEEKIKAKNETISKLFLSALTTHKSDNERLQKVFKPLFNKYKIFEEQTLKY